MDQPYRQRESNGPPHLRCLYCGLERKAIADACSQCQAAAPSVPCASCGREVPSPLAECVCGAPCFAWSDGPSALVGCPRCGGQTLARVELDVTSVHVEQCQRCLGCFARTCDFSELLAREEAGEAVGLRRFVPLPPGRELPRQALLALVRCPHCPKTMDRVRFADRASLVVDVCSVHGIWLDAGELVSVVEFVKERHTSGSVPPGPDERAEEQMWNRVEMLHVREEAVVDRHIDRAEASNNLVRAVGASAIGGPWLGFFVALRHRARGH